MRARSEEDYHYCSNKYISSSVAFTWRECCTVPFKHSPPRKVPGAPGANNHRHISGGFPIGSLHIIFGVVIVVAAGTTHFARQATVNNDGDLL